MSFALEDLVTVEVDLPGGPLTLRQPPEWADLPDDQRFEWAPMAPYWAVMWRSGPAVARLLAERDLRGQRVIELGCGLALPSLAAARAGAEAMATDEDPDALALVGINAEANGLGLEMKRFDFIADEAPGEFDLVLAADILYEETSVGPLLELLPRLAPKAIVASPARTPFERFAKEAELSWEMKGSSDGVVEILEINPG